MSEMPADMKQTEFADHMGVTPPAVSQWKKRDILRDDAFTLPGKKGKVIVAVAVEQVRLHRDIGQSLGNGIETRTSNEVVAAIDVDAPAEVMPVEIQPDFLTVAAVPTEQATAAIVQPEVVTVESRHKHARLEQQLRLNRLQASEEASRQGMLMSAEDVRDKMAREAGILLQTFEGALTDFAEAIASQFDVPQRDVMHLLKVEFRSVRQRAARKERLRADTVEKDITVTVELDA